MHLRDKRHLRMMSGPSCAVEQGYMVIYFSEPTDIFALFEGAKAREGDLARNIVGNVLMANKAENAKRFKDQSRELEPLYVRPLFWYCYQV